MMPQVTTAQMCGGRGNSFGPLPHRQFRRAGDLPNREALRERKSRLRLRRTIYDEPMPSSVGRPARRWSKFSLRWVMSR